MGAIAAAAARRVRSEKADERAPHRTGLSSARMREGEGIHKRHSSRRPRPVAGKDPFVRTTVSSTSTSHVEPYEFLLYDLTPLTST